MDFKKTSLRLDFDIVKEASKILGTRSLADTVNRALKEIVDRHKRRRFFTKLASEDAFEWELLDRAWGGDK